MEVPVRGVRREGSYSSMTLGSSGFWVGIKNLDLELKADQSTSEIFLCIPDLNCFYLVLSFYHTIKLFQFICS